MADFDVKQLAVDLLSELKALSGIGNSAGGDDGKSGQKYKGDPAVVDLKIFKDAAELLAHKLDGLAQQIGINTTALKAIPGAYIGLQSTDDTSKAFSNAINLLGKDIAKFASKLEEQRLQAAAGLNAGIGQGNFLTQRAEFQKAGFKNFEDGLKGVTDATGNFKSSLAGLGHSADDSTRKFNKFAEGLGNTEAIQTLIKRNIIQPTDVPKLALLAAQGKTSALDTPESRDKLIAEMAREALIISQMSIAYGINKQALMDNAIAINETSEAQIRQGALADDNSRRAMRTAQVLSIPSGKTMAELVGKLYSGARLSKEDRALLSVGTMGMGGQLTSATQELKRTKDLPPDDKQRLAAEDRFLDVQAQIRSRLLGVEGQRLAQSMKEGPQRAALEKMITEARAAALTEAKIQKELGVSSREAARVAQIRLGGAAFRGEEQNVSGAATPTANTGAKVSETLAEANLAYGKNATAVSDIVAKLNIELGTAAKGFKAVKDALTGELGPGDANESVAEKKKRLAPLANAIEGVASAPNTISEAERNAAGQNATGGQARPTPPPATTVTPPATPPATTVTPPATTTTQPVQPTMRRRADGTPEEIPPRAHGTLGEIGQTTEPKDIIVQLHKGERVLSVDEVANMSAKANAMLANIAGNNNNANSGQSGGIDMTNPLGNVATNVSSANTPSQITSDTIYTGTLKALKELSITTLPQSLTPAPVVKKESVTAQKEDYTIKNGDTLTKISKEMGISIQDIMKANPFIKDKDKIYAGTKLELPVLKTPTVTSPPVTADYAALRAQYDKLAINPSATVEALASLKAQMEAAMKNQEAPVIQPVTVTTPEPKVPVIQPVTVTTPKVEAPVIQPVTVTTPKVEAPVIQPVTVTTPKVEAPVIQPVTVTTPVPKLPALTTDPNYKTSSIIDKQLAKAGIDINNLFDKLSTTPETGFKKIFDIVSTSISSITSVGSTTRKSVQNEDSKAAQEQIEALMSQYDKDRDAIGSKLKEALGPNAKNSDVLNELNVNPEAVALEARMKSTAKDLSDRIEAGTSTETTFESRIQRGNIVEKSTTSVPITDAMTGFQLTPTENQKEERAEESQTIDLNDSEPKTKDLYDQLIQLNSSIRQLVEHSASGVDLAGAQIKATRSLSGNRFA